MLSNEGMMRAANMIQSATGSISRSAETANFDTQRIIESMENSIQRPETSIENFIYYFKEIHR